MNKPLIFFCVFGHLAMNLVLAQSEPNQRVVGRLQPGMNWQVEELPSSARLLGGDKSVNAETPGKLVKKGSVGRAHRRQEILSPEGEWTDQYITREFLLTRQPDGSFSLESPVEDPESGLQRQRPDRLQEFSWLEGLAPSGRMTIDGVDCEIYALRFDRVPVKLSVGSQEGLNLVAAIGLVDRFPRRLETPSRVLRYIPQPARSPETLPIGAQEVIMGYEKRLRQLKESLGQPR